MIKPLPTIDYLQAVTVVERPGTLRQPTFQPTIMALPVNLFVLAFACDIGYALSHNGNFAQLAYYNLCASIIGGLIAATADLLDWWSLPAHTEAKHIGRMHGIGNGLLLVLFILSWVPRTDTASHAPTAAGFVIALLAISLHVSLLLWERDWAARLNRADVVRIEAD